MTDLLTTVERHLADTQTSAATFGREVMNDPNFVFDLRKGRDYRRSTENRIRQHIAGCDGNERAAE